MLVINTLLSPDLNKIISIILKFIRPFPFLAFALILPIPQTLSPIPSVDRIAENMAFGGEVNLRKRLQQDLTGHEITNTKPTLARYQINRARGPLIIFPKVENLTSPIRLDDGKSSSFFHIATCSNICAAADNHQGSDTDAPTGCWHSILRIKSAVWNVPDKLSRGKKWMSSKDGPRVRRRPPAGHEFEGVSCPSSGERYGGRSGR